jgi:peroxiredoxin
LLYYKEGIKSLKKYNKDMDFLSFSLPNIDDKLISIDAYKDKIILVDFWASWCKPCRTNHPDLVNLYEEFKTKNFDIVSVSIDKNLSSWEKAIEKDGLMWENLIDKESKVSNELGVQEIPFNYLLDYDGKIIAINLSVKEIKNILTQKILATNKQSK